MPEGCLGPCDASYIEEYGVTIWYMMCADRTDVPGTKLFWSNKGAEDYLALQKDVLPGDYVAPANLDNVLSCGTFFK